MVEDKETKQVEWPTISFAIPDRGRGGGRIGGKREGKRREGGHQQA
jgi:hypothetical protein